MGDIVLRARPRYRVEIEAPPRAKQRPFHTKAGQTFTRKETVNAEAWIRLKVTQTVGTPLVRGPVKLRIGFVMPMPKGMPKADRPDALAGRKHPLSKPDWDNLAKLVCDALNGIAWRDDAHVTVAGIVKVYGEDPRTVLEWWQMTPLEAMAEAVDMGLVPPPSLI